MKSKFFSRKAILFTTALGLFVSAFIITVPRKTIRTPNVTGHNISNITLNMSVDNVVSILGAPYSYEVDDHTHIIGCQHPKPTSFNFVNVAELKNRVTAIYADTNYCCNASKESLQGNKRITLHYTKPSLPRSYPMLWVHFNESLKTSSVFAKEYFFFGTDDQTFYSLSSDTITNQPKTKSEIEDVLNYYFD